MEERLKPPIRSQSPSSDGRAPGLLEVAYELLSDDSFDDLGYERQVRNWPDTERLLQPTSEYVVIDAVEGGTQV